MNFFVTSSDELEIALDHCRVHLNKMIVEHCQLMSTAHHVLDGAAALHHLYRKTHVNHPSAVWVRESSANYLFMLNVTWIMCELFAKRTGKEHASKRVLEILSSPPVNIPHDAMTPFKPAFPDEYKEIVHTHDIHTAYQWYLNDKLNTWLWYNKHYMEGVAKRPVDFDNGVPEWFVEDHWYIKSSKPVQTVPWNY